MSRIAIKKSNNKFYLFIFLYAFFSPRFYNFFGSSGAIIVNGGIIFLLCFYFLLNNKNKIKFKNDNELLVFKIFAFTMIYYFISIAFSILFLSEVVVFRDYFEFHRPVLYLLIIIYAFNCLSYKEKISFFNKIINYVFWGGLFLSLNQHFRFFDIINFIYTKGHNISSGRLAVPGVNPYDLAFIFSFLFFVFFYRFIFDDNNKKLNIIKMMLSFIIIILTQSRMVFGAFLLTLGIQLIIMLIINKKIVKGILPKWNFKIILLGFLTTIFLGIIISFYQDSIGYLISGFERVFITGERLGPLEMRLDQFLYVFERSNNNPLLFFFGNGPSKAIMEYVESIYTYYFFRYGFIGFVVIFFIPYIISLFYLFNLAIKLNYIKNKYKSLVYGLLAFMIFIPIASLGNNFTEQIRISFLYNFILVLNIKLYYSLKVGDFN